MFSYLEEKIKNVQESDEKEKNEKMPTKPTNGWNPLPVTQKTVDNLAYKSLQNLQNDFIPPSVEVGQHVLIHAQGMSKDNRKGIVTHIRKLRDGRNEICVREDGSVILEAIVKVETESELFENNNSSGYFYCLIPGDEKTWLEILEK